MRGTPTRFRDGVHTDQGASAGKKAGASYAVEDVGDFNQNVAGIAVGLLAVAGELGAEVADEPRGEAGGQGERGRLSGDGFFAVVRDGVIGQRARRVEEDVVISFAVGGSDELFLFDGRFRPEIPRRTILLARDNRKKAETSD